MLDLSRPRLAAGGAEGGDVMEIFFFLLTTATSIIALLLQAQINILLRAAKILDARLTKLEEQNQPAKLP